MGCSLRGMLLSVTMLTAAYGAAVLPPPNTGHFYVSSWNTDVVVVYDSGGSFLRFFGTEAMNGPRGIVIHPESGEIFVAGQLSNAIFVFDAQEQYVRSFTHEGFDTPTGMALSPDGLLYVASFNLDEVWVFETDGTFIRTFTGGGLNGPNCVAFDNAGNIYVASAFNDLVIKFDPKENFVDSFHWDGSPNSPMGIARDVDDNLYVASGSTPYNIVKFSADGTLLDVYSHPDLTGPQGVAFDDRGHLFSSSYFDHLVVEFDAQGNYVQTITKGGLLIPRSIAFVRMLVGDVNDDGAVDITDLLALIANWGPCQGCPSDLDDNGVVDINDLLTLIGNWS